MLLKSTEHELTATLPTGELRVRVTESLVPAGDLFTFAVRRNPKRAFLFLSKVLGKEVPAFTWLTV